MPRFLDLSPELALLIFGYLPSIKDALNLSQTCSKFFALFHHGSNKARILYAIVTQDDAWTCRWVQEIFQNRLIQTTSFGRWALVQANKQRYVLLSIDFAVDSSTQSPGRFIRSLAEIQHLAIKASTTPSLKELVITFVAQFAISKEDLHLIMTNETFDHEWQFDIFIRAARLQLDRLAEVPDSITSFESSGDRTIIALALDIFAHTKHWQEAGQNSPMTGLMDTRLTYPLVRAFVSLNPVTAHPNMNLSVGSVENIKQQSLDDRLAFRDGGLLWELQTLIKQIHHIMLRGDRTLMLDIFYALDILMYCKEVNMDVVNDWLAPVRGLKTWLNLELANLCAVFLHYAEGAHPLQNPWLSETVEELSVIENDSIILDGYQISEESPRIGILGAKMDHWCQDSSRLYDGTLRFKCYHGDTRRSGIFMHVSGRP